MHADLDRAMLAGADDYLLKPFNREIIEMKLQEIRARGLTGAADVKQPHRVH